MATLEKIYHEIKALRKELSIFIPQESIAEYAHPRRIISAYRRATLRYPNRSRSHASN